MQQTAAHAGFVYLDAHIGCKSTRATGTVGSQLPAAAAAVAAVLVPCPQRRRQAGHGNRKLVHEGLNSVFKPAWRFLGSLPPLMCGQRGSAELQGACMRIEHIGRIVST